tara:strand:- start:133 stop:342 length:210 start_codon:yes stop_codon:yes gene_type:complete
MTFWDGEKAWFQEELELNHAPSLDHWAKILATDDIESGEESYWDYAYEQAWHWLDAEYNYNYEYRESWL